jgi:hypothetical protein
VGGFGTYSISAPTAVLLGKQKAAERFPSFEPFFTMDAPEPDPEERAKGEKDVEPTRDPNREAAKKAEDAAEALSEELRNALQAKVEQGRSGSGFVPPDED